MEIIKYLEESGLLYKGVTWKIENKITIPWKGKFHGLLANTLAASLLANTTGKAIIHRQGVIRAGERGRDTIRTGQNF